MHAIILALLNGWKKNHLQLAIAEDVSVAGLLLEHKRDIARIGKVVAFMYSNQKDEFNIKNVMLWLETNRPDLYSVFDESKEARAWLRKQIKEMKELLFGAGNG